MRPVLAVLMSDLHLCARAPAARAGEKDWWQAMARPLREVRQLCAEHGVPAVVAGDLFDRWHAGPEVINFAFKHLPDTVYAIPGQHDLPNHDYGARFRGAYGTLVVAGRIKDLRPGEPCEVNGFYAFGFPWGTEIKPLARPRPDTINLAVVHAYVYGPRGSGYVGAPKTAHVIRFRRALRGYDAAVFGDNHRGFLVNGGHLLNSGTLMRRSSDEAGYRPHVGLLRDNGRIDVHYLNTDEDSHSSIPQPELAGRLELGLPGELLGASADSLDYREEVRCHLERIRASKQVRTAVYDSIDNP